MTYELLIAKLDVALDALREAAFELVGDDEVATPRVTNYGASAVIVEASDVIGNRVSFFVGAADAPRPEDPVEVIITIAPVR